ncbi:hypothetical protein FRC20_005328 [Serendipita sp. 405]|nr:hypothetical protein FRC20_005328 [Serendipita sp. 405]
MSTISIFGIVFGCIWRILEFVSYALESKGDSLWVNIFDISQNIRQLPLIFIEKRSDILESAAMNKRGFFYAVPSCGIVLFVCFGLGPTALNTYRVWIEAALAFSRLPTVYVCLGKHLEFSSRRPGFVDPESFSPFELDSIMLEPCPPPSIGSRWHSVARKAHSSSTIEMSSPFNRSNLHRFGPDNIPKLIHPKRFKPFIKEPLLATESVPKRNLARSKLQEPPSVASGRWRSLRKEPIPLDALPSRRTFRQGILDSLPPFYPSEEGRISHDDPLSSFLL